MIHQAFSIIFVTKAAVKSVNVNGADPSAIETLTEALKGLRKVNAYFAEDTKNVKEFLSVYPNVREVLNSLQNETFRKTDQVKAKIEKIQNSSEPNPSSTTELPPPNIDEELFSTKILIFILVIICSLILVVLLFLFATVLSFFCLSSHSQRPERSLQSPEAQSLPHFHRNGKTKSN